jgi:hypothetical protein
LDHKITYWPLSWNLRPIDIPNTHNVALRIYIYIYIYTQNSSVVGRWSQTNLCGYSLKPIYVVYIVYTFYIPHNCPETYLYGRLYDSLEWHDYLLLIFFIFILNMNKYYYQSNGETQCVCVYIPQKRWKCAQTSESSNNTCNTPNSPAATLKVQVLGFGHIGVETEELKYIWALIITLIKFQIIHV